MEDRTRQGTPGDDRPKRVDQEVGDAMLQHSATDSDPFTAEPSVQFYVPTTSVAADHAPCVCVAAFLAALDFVPRGC